ncbi:MAG TPA: tRNA (adenosine(37)-N6)-threonylcarbamoyltransferase complex dimerization subunit type 1 TsaB [Bryobacteraceae bacterium]|nr:tRNA (adenosine(37)-N6)-threonylcarbamoyltransferase complex dimerization subunit type 1 TsaB [Bryobacteraceae bacterium]
MTPLVFALDTTREHGSIALVRGAEVLAELPVHSTDGFSHVIYGHVEALLRQCAIDLRDVDLFAAASGPGSFTGVRVGLACVKGLADAMGKPAAAVSNLRAIASFGSAVLRAPLLDARRAEVYAAVYNDAGDLIQPEIVGKFDAWRTVLPAGAEILSPDFTAEGVTITRTPNEIAAAIARLAPQFASDPAALDANYVRRSDAELFWKEPQ